MGRIALGAREIDDRVDQAEVGEGLWEVAEECSGVRYLIPAFALGCVYAYQMYSSRRRRIAFVLISSLAPVIGNGIRAYGVVMLTHFGGESIWAGWLARAIETTTGHLLYGWLMFMAVLSVFAWWLR